jgi:hypothetical protein
MMAGQRERKGRAGREDEDGQLCDQPTSGAVFESAEVHRAA